VKNRYHIQITCITFPYCTTKPNNFLFSDSFCFFSISAACWKQNGAYSVFNFTFTTEEISSQIVAYVQSFNQICVSRIRIIVLRCLPKLFLSRISVHRTYFEQTICNKHLYLYTNTRPHRYYTRWKPEFLPRNFFGGLFKSPALGLTTVLSSTNLQTRKG